MTMSSDLVSEICISAAALTMSVFGTLVSMASASLVVGQAVGGINITDLVTQFGGLALAVWLAIHHTTITIPNLQKEHKEERLEATKLFKEELDLKRMEYLGSLKELSEMFENELKIRREEFEKALDKLTVVVEKTITPPRHT